MRRGLQHARVFGPVAVAVQLLGLAGRAGAEPSADDRAPATTLFEEGRALMSAGRTGEACPKLEESHRLDPSGGTILNLALCHEQEGRLARSWSEFHEALSFARRDGRSDREQFAEAHVRALEPRLSRLTIAVPESARIDGLRIERDGRELGVASWSIALPVDGGEHTIRASAPGRSPFTTTIVMGAASDSEIVEIPPLATAPAPPSPAALAPVPAVSALLVEAPGPRPDEAHLGGKRRLLAWTIGAAGLAQWGAAAYFGLVAFRRHADSNSACPDEHCSQSGVELNDESRRAADTSTVLAITGLATVAISLYLLWTSAARSEGAGSAHASRGIGIGSTGSTILLQGSF